MPALLERLDEELTLSLSGCRGGEFQDVLAKAREVPGRKFDGKRKLWCFPANPQTAERIIHAIQPTHDPKIAEWIRETRKETEQDLVTPLPDDADVLVPWGKERMPWQPEEINNELVTGLKAHQRALVANMASRCIIADDLGLGKTVQALSYVAEFLLKYRHDKEQKDLRAGVEKGEQGQNSLISSRIEGTPNPSTEAGDDQGQISSISRTRTSKNSNDHRQDKGTALCGLRDLSSSALYGLGSCNSANTISDWKLPVDQIVYWQNKTTNGRSRDKKVQGEMRELPSAEALARRPKLIICPLSVTGVWQREIKRWLGEDAITATGLSTSKRSKAIQSAIEKGSWLIVNYEQLRVKKEEVKTKNGGIKIVKVMNEPLFENTQWFCTIIDEAHRLKNRKAAQTQGAFRLNSLIMLLLTGTPIVNSPEDLWSLLHVLFPDEYKSFWRFYEQYVDYVEGYFGRDIIGVRNPDALRFELNKRVYRRTKDQVLDLPEKQRVTIPVELDAKARKMYAQAETELWLELETKIQEGDAEAAKFAMATTQKIIYTIPNGAARTVRLRQILSTPALLGGEDHSNKMDALVDSISDASHKQHVVFSEFVQSCDILAKRLRASGLAVETYTGETNQKDRAGIEDKFQRGEIDVLVGTIGAMREGLTLTAADTVHFLERSWVPAWNHQAEDRLHRIGQSNCVTVYIYEAVGTIDDGNIKITNSLKNKIMRTVLPQDDVKESLKV